MGKISEAFERHQKEGNIKLESMVKTRGKKSVPEEREPALYDGSNFFSVSHRLGLC